MRIDEELIEIWLNEVCDKIFWTLAFFKDRHAAKWSKNLFCQEANTGIFPI